VSYQENIIEATDKAIEALFRSARAMPVDKLEWSPLDQGRTVLDQLQECAQSPAWFITMLTLHKFPDMTPEDMAKGREARKQWKTIDECEKVCKENSAKLYEVIRGVPEADFMIMVHLPFGEGLDMPLMAIMAAHHWNLVYHNGQVNYIQTLYGDKEMH
jgi:hypothetical protein